MIESAKKIRRGQIGQTSKNRRMLISIYSFLNSHLSLGRRSRIAGKPRREHLSNNACLKNVAFIQRLKTGLGKNVAARPQDEFARRER